MAGSLCGKCEGFSWCGECYEIKKGKTTKGYKRPPADLHPDVRSLDPPSATPDQEAAQPLPMSPRTVDPSWRVRYPHIYAHLTQGRHVDGSLRVTSTLLMFMEDGRLKLCLHDREEGLVAFLTVSGLPQGFAELEDGLASGSLAWRKKRTNGQVAM